MSSPDLDRSIIESASDFAIVATDLKGIVTRWNAGAESILRWSEAEMLGQPVDIIFTPEDQLQGRPSVERRRAQDEGRAINERWHQRKDGSRFWASGEMFPLRDTAGAHIGFVKVLRDRTPEHLRGEELEARAGERDRLWHLSEDLMAVGHTDGTLVSINPAWERVLGWSEDELLGRRFFFLIHPDDLERTDAKNQRVTSGQIESSFQNRLRHKNGSYRWISWNAVPDANRVHAVGRDVTEQRQLDERLQMALWGGRIVLWEYNLATGYVTRSDNAMDVLGIGSGQADEFYSRVHEEDRALLTPSEAAAPRSDSFQAEVRYLRPDGHWVWLQEWVTIRRDREGGPPARLVGLSTDITVRKEAELAVQESEARYRLLAQNSTDMIGRTTLQGERLYLSPACRDLLGYEPEELIGSHVADITHPDDIAAVTTSLGELLSAPDGHLTVTYRLRHKKGHWVWLENSRRLVRNAAGEPIEFVSVGRDVTERLRLEEQLRQSQRMEAVGQLTGGIAHDFNNLLTVILGNAEILAEEVQDPSLQGLAKMTEETASRAAELTGKLLAFGRRQTLTPEPVALDEAVLGMVGLLNRTLGGHVEIKLAMKPSQSAALTDRTLFESAILNLAVNARDAMPQGGTLTISTEERFAGHKDGTIPVGLPVVSVTVSDTGIGMAPDVLTHAFEPFFTTKDVGQGTGLGLAMVYGFAEQSGGHVSIESQEGKGTSVTIVLRAVGKEEAQAAGDDRMLPARGGERVLVVEDEPSVRQFVETQLKSLGYEVTSVATGPEAMALLEQGECFDLLFSDVVLPKGMNGVELSRRAVARCSGLKVLLTSGYSEDVFEQHGRPEEGTLLLRKPYRRKELAETLRKVLDG